MKRQGEAAKTDSFAGLMVAGVWGGPGICFIYQALNWGIFILFLTLGNIRVNKPRKADNTFPITSEWQSQKQC